jgi:hypothetical protein
MQPYQPSQSPPPPHQPHQPGTYGQQPYQQPPYQQPATPAYLRTPPEARDALKSKGTRDIVFGAVWIAAGLGITLMTFAMLDGAAMIVAWGPAGYGVYKIIKGLIRVNRAG